MKKYLILSSMILILNACGGGSSSSTNSAPIANAGEDKVAIVNQYLPIVGTGTDIDGTIVSYEWKKEEVVLATTATFDYLATRETTLVTISPRTSLDIGTDILTLTVTDDDGATSTDEIEVRVIEEVASNSSPTANAGEDKYIGYSESVTIVGKGDDSDGEVIIYEWKMDDYVFAETATLTYSPSELIRSPFSPNGVDELTLVVTDNEGNQGTDSVLIEFYDDSTSSSSDDSTPICGENGVIVSPCRTRTDKINRFDPK